MQPNWSRYFVLPLVGGLLFLPLVSGPAGAATLEELRSKIADRNMEIAKLEKDIESYQTELDFIGRTTTSLKSEISRLDTTSKKLAADIKVTENKIAKTDLRIEELTFEIGDKNQTLAERRLAIQEILRCWRLVQDESLVELLINRPRLSDAWTELSVFSSFDRDLQKDIQSITSVKQELEGSQDQAKDERAQLAVLTERLHDQRQIAQSNRFQKDSLLAKTKNEEANYKKLLNESVARRDAFAKEIFELESELRIVINPDLLPTTGRGVLGWPLDAIFITQQFGKTIDAKRLYASGTHNGIDFRASPGTPIKAATTGEVLAVGDTDLVCPGASYGKWVVLKHGNGLSTLYAHLSLIKVKVGQGLTRGEVLAYSGSTGYATGPHLHFTVFATEGMRLAEYNFRSCPGAKITLPLADPGAYLDPALYL